MSDMNTTWRTELSRAFEEANDAWENIEASTLTDSQLDRSFYAGYGGSEGDAFTVWTKTKVYFPIVYDGSEWVGWVSRNPDGVPTAHQGGQ